MLNKIGLSFGGKAGYTSLGSFEFVESDNQTYHEINIVDGSQYFFILHSLVSVNNLWAGIDGGSDYQIIGTVKNWDGSFWDGYMEYNCRLGKLYGKAGYNDQKITGEIGYSYEFHYAKSCICLGCFYSDNINRILKAKAEFENYKKDLKLSVMYRFGILYNVYDYTTVLLIKRSGHFEYSVSFSPSSLDKNLFSAGLAYYFGENKNDYNLY